MWALAGPKVGELIGALDGLRSEVIDHISVDGWACSYGSRQALQFTVFVGGVKVSAVAADKPSNAAVARACGAEGAHHFSAPINIADVRHNPRRPIVIAIGDSSRQVKLNGTSLLIPADAGSVRDVVDIPGLNLLIDCSLNGGLNCAAGLNASMNGTGGAPSYAYAASIVIKDGLYHMFVCSVGAQGGWDGIRYTASSDGFHWGVPVLKLVTTAAPNRDKSACDPSTVYFQGYYYLYYGSAYVSTAGNRQTVIQVARSSAIDGDYQIFSESGKWGATEEDPPAMLIKPSRDVANSYGAGQPSVVVAAGELFMWYTDDTAEYPHGNILMMHSTNPTMWVNPLVTNARTVNVDVKSDPKTQQFVMFSLDNIGTKEIVRTRTSTDGLTWSAPEALGGVPSNPFSFFGQNIGVSGDATGTLPVGPLLITYMAPFLSQLKTDAGRDMTGKRTRPEWNLYGVFTSAK